MKKVLGLSLLLTSATFINCADDDPIDPATVIEAAKTEFVANYVNIVEASYDDALAKAKDLKTAIDVFTKAPDATKFQKAKEAWLDSREPYGQTEAYRFYDGPIDGANGEPEGYINAWPLDEGLIDYVTAGTSGSTKNLINDTSFNLTKTNIKALTGEGGESNVTIGYHAIEFLLWGQDSTAPSEKKAGQRAYTDYTTAANADRRKQYLQLAAEILVDDLESVVKQWKPGAAYRKQFLALSKNDAIDKILTGAAKLSKGELAGERMATAVEKQDQEEEHSCFSDNTHRDIYLNALSINNIIHGTYKRIDGSTVTGFSLLDLLLLVNATESATLKTTSEVVMTKVKAISDAKFFDYQIIGEALDNNTKPVMATVFSLRKQGDQLAQSGKTITGKIIDASVE
ncbi:imelysin family protein [Tenacibaculum maritimum]|uniref:imelysin family protein n=1 Tax=Tenacibaculum maritimum TaxID=107401 RepID=UPI0012E3FED6|nr:imelysin family protein [Tenacibaculum maritimum]MCD9561704.1 hypothetical protein [Tenacibaculum maritimum]MCD9564711.1 hypothetical protein [Tenacibaculum maritimum]MCD9577840.1 hypothetical protein [Tenacibaculum maritimum]MCD9596724.1 hypothetical protein [Tenacibaculum maritimum]MCD9612362.1 hypothetical protein [Tenacibaculum maritimum]